MWVLTTHGFYSAVEDWRDPDRLVVRARVRADLVKLKRLIPRLRIIEGEGTDYAFRAYVARDEWVDALAAMGDAIDYENFKDAVKARQGHKRATVYGRVWGALFSLQPSRFDPWDYDRRPGKRLAAALRARYGAN